jgi:hypothetical protein
MVNLFEARLKFTLYHATNASALDGVGGQRHTQAALPPGKTQYPLYGRLGGQGPGVAILTLTRIRSPDRPACGESLCRLCYSGPHCLKESNSKCFMTVVS